MSDYISREAAIKLGYWHGEKPTVDNPFPDGVDAVDIVDIENLPAADVREVRMGHKVTHNRPIAGYWANGKLDGGWNGMEGCVWIEPIMDNPVDYCSECGKRLDDIFQNYCPNCGALMEEQT